MLSKKTYKMKKAWGPVLLDAFLWLGQQMLRPRPAISIAVFVERTSLYWLKVTTKFWETSRAASIFHATNVWSSRRQAGKCWTTRGPAEVEGERYRKMRAPLLVRHREYPFSVDVIVDETGAVDPILGIMAKVSSLIEVLRLGGSFELVYHIWAQFTLSAVQINVEVTSSRDEVLVFLFVPYCLCSLSAFCLVRVCVHHSQWDVSSNFVSLHQLG